MEALRRPDHVLAPVNDSGEQDYEPPEPEIIWRVHDNINVCENEEFPAFGRLDGESDDEAENAPNPEEEDIPIYSRVDVPNNFRRCRKSSIWLSIQFGEDVWVQKLFSRIYSRTGGCLGQLEFKTAVFRDLMKHSIVNSVHDYVFDVFGVYR